MDLKDVIIKKIQADANANMDTQEGDVIIVKKDMVQNGLIVLVSMKFFGKIQKKYFKKCFFLTRQIVSLETFFSLYFQKS